MLELPKFEDFVTPLNNLPNDNIFDNLFSCLDMLQGKIDDIRSLATLMIPNIKLTAKDKWNKIQEHARTKREAPLGFIGSLSKSLFGTATTEDFNKVASKINSVIGQQRNLAHELALHDEILQSYMKINDGRIDNHTRMIKSNSKAVIDLAKNMQHSFDYFQRSLQRTRQQVSFATKVCLDVATTMDYLASLKADLKNLIRGQLGIDIIPPVVLNSFFINATEQARSLGLQFVDTNPINYYRKSSYVLTLHNNSIWITMKFALGKPLNLYQVLVWPMPVGDNFKHGTIVEDLPNFVGIEDENYMEFDAGEIARCDKDKNLIKCEKQKPLLSTMRTRSCTAAMILGNQQEIKEYCKLTLQKNAIQPTIRTISDDKILVQDVSTMKLNCNNEPEKTMDGCKTCILTVPCDCVITTSNILFRTPTTDRCQRRTAVTHLFQKNVAIFSHFFEETAKKMKAMEWFEKKGQQELRLNINTTQLEKKLHDFLTSDAKSEVGLQEVQKKMEEARKRAEELASQEGFATLYGNPMAQTILGVSLSFTVILYIVGIIALWRFFPRILRRFNASERKRRRIPVKEDNESTDTYRLMTTTTV